MLDTIKKALGLSLEDNSFDMDIIMYINAAIAILSQLGLQEADAMPVIDSSTEWPDFLGERSDLELVKTYIYFRVKIMFDPPTNTAALDAIKNTIENQEWRIVNLPTIKGVIQNDE